MTAPLKPIKRAGTVERVTWPGKRPKTQLDDRRRSAVPGKRTRTQNVPTLTPRKPPT